MDQQGLQLTVDHVLLNLGNVVRHIVDHVHVEVVGVHAKRLAEGLSKLRLQVGTTEKIAQLSAHLSAQVCHAGAIDPGKVGGRGHALEVVLALGRVDARTGQLGARMNSRGEAEMQ